MFLYVSINRKVYKYYILLYFRVIGNNNTKKTMEKQTKLYTETEYKNVSLYNGLDIPIKEINATNKDNEQ